MLIDSFLRVLIYLIIIGVEGCAESIIISDSSDS